MVSLPNTKRLEAQRYNLQGVICLHCGANIFPPREICPYCQDRGLEKINPLEADDALKAVAGTLIRQAAK